MRVLRSGLIVFLALVAVVQPAVADTSIIVDSCRWGCWEDDSNCEFFFEYTVITDCCPRYHAEELVSTVGECGCQSKPMISPDSEGPVSTSAASQEPPNSPSVTRQQHPEQPQTPPESPATTGRDQVEPAIALPQTEMQPPLSDETITPGPSQETTSPSAQRMNTEGLFDEPTPTARPETSTNTEPDRDVGPANVLEGSDDLFEEPKAEVPRQIVPQSSLNRSQGESTDRTTPPANDPLEGLFGPPSPNEETKPSIPQPEAPKNTDGTDSMDPFGISSPLQKRHTVRGKRSFRLWHNIKAGIEYDASLVRYVHDGIELSGRTGEIVKLSFSHLSSTDLEFLHEDVRTQRSSLALRALSPGAMVVGTSR